jgi:hypothetical protein
MNRELLKKMAGIVLLSLLFACDQSDLMGVDGAALEEETMFNGMAKVVETKEQLPRCNPSVQSAVYYIRSEKQLVFCNGRTFEPIALPSDTIVNITTNNDTLVIKDTLVYKDTIVIIQRIEVVAVADTQKVVDPSWLGVFAKHPLNKKSGDVYYNSTDGVSYRYDGFNWKIHGERTEGAYCGAGHSCRLNALNWWSSSDVSNGGKSTSRSISRKADEVKQSVSVRQGWSWPWAGYGFDFGSMREHLSVVDRNFLVIHADFPKETKVWIEFRQTNINNYRYWKFELTGNGADEYIVPLSQLINDGVNPLPFAPEQVFGVQIISKDVATGNVAETEANFIITQIGLE